MFWGGRYQGQLHGKEGPEEDLGSEEDILRRKKIMSKQKDILPS